MKAISMMISFGLRQAMGGESDGLARNLLKFFSDSSQSLPDALKIANKRAWQAFELAIVGNSLNQRLKQCFTSEEIKAFSRQVDTILATQHATFRSDCLQEMLKLKQQGVIDNTMESSEVATMCASMERFTNPQGLIDGAWKVIEHSANELVSQGYVAIGQLLQHKTEEGPPLLIAAFGYFLRREVSNDEQLSEALYFDLLRQVGQKQTAGFNALHKAVKTMGDEFQQALNEVSIQLSRIEDTVTETHHAVLNIDNALVETRGEMRQLIQEVQQQLSSIQAHQEIVQASPNLSAQHRQKKHNIQNKGQRYEPSPETVFIKEVSEFTVTTQTLPIASDTYISGGKVYKQGETAQIKARSKSPKWRFSHWSGDVSGKQKEISLVVNKNTHVIAHFDSAWLDLQLHIIIQPTESGSVFGAGNYFKNEHVKIKAIANKDWIFTHWSGDLNSATSDEMIIMDNDKRLTAHFKQTSLKTDPHIPNLGKAFS